MTDRPPIKHAEAAGIRIAAGWGVGSASPRMVNEIQQAIDDAVKEEVQPLVKAAQLALNWSFGEGPFSDGRDTITNLAEDVAPKLEAALALAKQKGWL